MTEFRSWDSKLILFQITTLLLIFLFQYTVGFSQTTGGIRQEVTPLKEIKPNVSDGVSDLIGDTVTVGGIASIASGVLHENYLQTFIQQDSTGLSLFSESFNKPINLGDSVLARGIVQEYYGLTEINVLEYEVFSDTRKQPLQISLSEAIDHLAKYEGMLVGGTGTVIGKGDRFNGKYLMISPEGMPDKSIMIYVTNFHSRYQDFDFESISIGDDLQIAGILSLYNPDTRGEEERTYKIHLRTSDDLSIIGVSRSQMILWGSLGLLIILIVAGWIISLRSTVKSKTEDLKQSLEDKEILLKEIHHRVKNNLAIMSGLFELQLDGTENEETKKALRNSQSRLKSMALVHDKLYNTSSLTEIEMSHYIRELVQSLRDTFVGPDQDITLEFDFDGISLDIDKAIPCGLLINEIVVNAFKHGFENKDSGVIRVSMKEQNGTAVLIITDNGEGIPDDFDIQQSSSLGMMLIDTFKNQLGAELEVDTGNGTRFTFSFTVK